MKIRNSEHNPVPQSSVIIIIIVTLILALKCSLKHCISRHCATMTTTNKCCGNFEYAGTYMKRHHCDKYTKPVLDLDIVKGYVLCTAEHCSLRSRKPKLYGDIKSRYPKITAAMEKLLYF